MKNKKNIYFLIPAVVLIWGLIGYRVYKTVNPSPIEVISNNTVNSFKPKKIASTKPYEINANYRDPFLGTLTTKKMKQRKKAILTTTSKGKIIFPTIAYKGIVSPKTKSKPAVFLIQINGKQYLMNLKNVEQEVKLISGNNKEVTFEFKKERKTISIQ